MSAGSLRPAGTGGGPRHRVWHGRAATRAPGRWQERPQRGSGGDERGPGPGSASGRPSARPGRRRRRAAGRWLAAPLRQELPAPPSAPRSMPQGALATTPSNIWSASCEPARLRRRAQSGRWTRRGLGLTHGEALGSADLYWVGQAWLLTERNGCAPWRRPGVGGRARPSRQGSRRGPPAHGGGRAAGLDGSPVGPSAHRTGWSAQRARTRPPVRCYLATPLSVASGAFWDSCWQLTGWWWWRVSRGARPARAAALTAVRTGALHDSCGWRGGRRSPPWLRCWCGQGDHRDVIASGRLRGHAPTGPTFAGPIHSGASVGPATRWEPA